MKLIVSLKDELSEITDPRVLGRTRHNLIDVLVLSVLAIICHAETWVDIENFGRAKEDWLRQFLELPNGIPSHDTVSRVFSIIDPSEFEHAFINWVNRVRTKRGVKDIICIDGKTIKGTVSVNEGNGRTKLNVVSVWSTYQGLVLGQMRANGTGNAETSAALELLDLIDVKELTVVGDAGIGKPSVANKIIAKGGNYIFPLKANTRNEFRIIDEMFSGIAEKNSRSQKVETHSTSEKSHGRKEERYCTIIRSKNFPDALNMTTNGDEVFHNMKVVGRIVYESEERETRPYVKDGDKLKQATNKVRHKKEIRYFVTSLNVSPKKLMENIRRQWAIENQLHWVLDVGLGEDGNTTRNKIAAANLSVVRKIAVNLAKQDKNSKLGIKARLKKAGWDDSYLEHLLFKKTLA